MSKHLLGKAVIPDIHPVSIGGLGLLGTDPASDAMSEADTLLMIGTSFPYIDYLPKPGQAKGVQIDIKADKIGLRYPVKVGLVGDSKTYINCSTSSVTTEGKPGLFKIKAMGNEKLD